MEKLTKKERKALQFKKSKEERDAEKAEKELQKAEEEEKSAKRPLEDGEEPKKKRKTRRGKKGKGVNGGKGPRFILFCGNLPFDVTEEEIRTHFKNCKPDRIRIRPDKGIAFLEFDNDTDAIKSKMEKALMRHHTMLKNRKINVELTVGGGGNSENRKTKLKEKNEKLADERKANVKENKKEAAVPAGVHPARAALMK